LVNGYGKGRGRGRGRGEGEGIREGERGLCTKKCDGLQASITGGRCLTRSPVKE
jgi:hypothetical protein